MGYTHAQGCDVKLTFSNSDVVHIPLKNRYKLIIIFSPFNNSIYILSFIMMLWKHFVYE